MKKTKIKRRFNESYGSAYYLTWRDMLILVDSEFVKIGKLLYQKVVIYDSRFDRNPFTSKDLSDFLEGERINLYDEVIFYDDGVFLDDNNEIEGYLSLNLRGARPGKETVHEIVLMDNRLEYVYIFSEEEDSIKNGFMDDDFNIYPEDSEIENTEDYESISYIGYWANGKKEEPILEESLVDVYVLKEWYDKNKTCYMRFVYFVDKEKFDILYQSNISNYFTPYWRVAKD